MTVHFAEIEFACRCGRPTCEAPTTVSEDLLAALEALRSRYGFPVLVTSGHRCSWWNLKEGGVADSAHVVRPGEVLEECDIAAPSSQARYDLLGALFLGSGPPIFSRVGVGPNFLHVGNSQRPGHAQHVCWTYYPKGAP